MLHAPVAAQQPPQQQTAEQESRVPPARQAWHAPHAPAPPVSGPSFLGLSSEPQKRGVEYLLEDDEPPPNHSRMIVALLLLLIAAGVLAWHWRGNVLVWWAQLRNTNPAVSVAPASSPSTTGGPVLGTSAATGQAPSEPLAPTVSSVTPRRTPPPLPSAGEANIVAPDTDASGSAADRKSSADSATANTASKPRQPKATGTQVAAQPAATSAPPKKTPPKQVASKTTAPAVKAPETKPAGSADDRLVAEGQKYLYGDGVPENCARAERNFRTAAGHSNAHAMSLLGTMYATGHCVGLDLPTAYRWYARALHLDPSNDRIAQDLQVLWRQMNADQRQAAIKAQ
jgi:cytoskeletal protein RodZ